MATKNPLTENTVALLRFLTLSLRLNVRNPFFPPTKGETGASGIGVLPISPLVGEKAKS
jgi:hypothetical protein